MQSLGQIIGPFLSANVYLLLSSEKWCMETLGLSGALLNLQTWLTFCSVFSIVASVVSFFLLKEPHHGEKPEISVKGLTQIVPKILFHKNARWEILMSFLFEITYNFVGQFYIVRLQEIGFSKEELSFIDSFMVVGDLLIMVILSKMDIAKNALKSYRYSNTICFIVVSALKLKYILIILVLYSHTVHYLRPSDGRIQIGLPLRFCDLQIVVILLPYPIHVEVCLQTGDQR